MTLDPETKKRLNLLLSSPTFVVQEFGEVGEGRLQVVPKIPASSGIYWVAGACTLAGGAEIDAVFRVDTNDGGS